MEMTWEAVKTALREVLQEELGMGRCPMVKKFEQGTLVFKPAEETLKGKEIPVNIFFKKITSVREKLRVLEQKINNHPTLSLEDRTEFQTLITRANGSLTSFNFLFRDEEDKFSGVKGD
jgi:hypothetical protein